MNKYCFFLFLVFSVFDLRAEEYSQYNVNHDFLLVDDSNFKLKYYYYFINRENPSPVAVFLHGCTGALNKHHELNSRLLMWKNIFISEGFNVLIVDSFSRRGIQTICGKNKSSIKLTIPDRANDAFRALSWLLSRNDVSANNIFLFGWSHGGSVALSVAVLSQNYSNKFRAIHAFYPGCATWAKKKKEFKPAVPVFIHSGQLDNWTPAFHCVNLVKSTSIRNYPVQLSVYSNAHHTFDMPGSQEIKQRLDIRSRINNDEFVTYGPNKDAREAAINATLKDLKRYLD